MIAGIRDVQIERRKQVFAIQAIAFAPLDEVNFSFRKTTAAANVTIQI
jgi:hypothetical protein